MSRYILSLDQGTTSSRALIFNEKGEKLSCCQQEFEQIFKNEGWVEHDPNDIWQSQLEVARQAVKQAGISAQEISGIGVTNQRETAIIWDKSTGRPVYNAIVWQCRRTADICERLEKQGLSKFFKDKTGLVIDPYFSATKIKWILDNVEGVRERAENGELLFGTVDSWLIWNLTGGKVHATDYTNASRTMLFNIHTLEWDDEILGLLGIPKAMLPKVVDSSGEIGVTEPSLFGAPIKICGCAGDQQAALFGQCCFHKGDIKNTYGTGGFLLMNTGSEPVKSKSGLLTTIAWSIGGKVSYALEGSVFVAGAVVKWLRDELRLIDDASQTLEIARSVEDSGGVYVVPAFVGLGTPYWDPSARGSIFGLTRGSSRAHIVRACLESICYQTADVIDAMVLDTGSLNRIRVDGGASANDFIMEFQSDILDRPVIRPENVESTATGAAFLAGLGCGVWSSQEELNQISGSFKEFAPTMPQQKRDELRAKWHKAVQRSLNWQE